MADYVGESFDGVTVTWLTGDSYLSCSFDNCTIALAGRPALVEACYFEGSVLVVDGVPSDSSWWGTENYEAGSGGHPERVIEDLLDG